MAPLAPLATLNGDNGYPLAPMVMAKMAPMAYPIAIGANGDRHWRQLRSPLVAIGAIRMVPMAPLRSDTKNEIAIIGKESQWH